MPGLQHPTMITLTRRPLERETTRRTEATSGSTLRRCRMLCVMFSYTRMENILA